LDFTLQQFWLLRDSFWLPIILFRAYGSFFSAGLVGLLTSVVFLLITQYYTEYRYRPVKSIAEASNTGSATNVITGFSVGLESTALPVIAISGHFFSLIISAGIRESRAVDFMGPRLQQWECSLRPPTFWPWILLGLLPIMPEELLKWRKQMERFALALTDRCSRKHY